MKSIQHNVARLLALTLSGLACTTPQAQEHYGVKNTPEVEAAIQAARSDKDALPGTRSCFWAYGPIGGDPYINVAYTDTGTLYWPAAFTIPGGAKLTLEGKFPHSRYMSVMSYDGAGVPLESAADYLIKPEAGSVNPFRPGADRTAKSRSYVLRVLNEPVDKRAVGTDLGSQELDYVHAPAYGKGQQVIIYRIYARDKGTDDTGSVGLPIPVVTMPDGKVYRGTEACTVLNSPQAPQLDPAAMAVPMNKYHELLEAAAKKSPTFPATNPPTWFIQGDREALYSMYNGNPVSGSGRSEGGFYPNLDNQYIRTILNLKHGRVFVMRGKAPTTPQTVNGDAKMGSGQLRYWSFCSVQGFANTRSNGCVHDENVPVDAKGYYTIVVSKAKDRPRNAIPECGINWLPIADDGDGAVDPDTSVLQLRHMLGAPDFPNAIKNVEKAGDEAKTMGEYFPRGRYMSASSVEAAFPCLIQKR